MLTFETGNDINKNATIKNSS